jgi:CheY-like chemotaxis protein
MTTDGSDPGDLRVLVIDDNVDTATSMSFLLQMLGCKSAVAYGGTMGLRVAQLFQPGLVFVDLDMPGPDGCETLVALRSLDGAAGQGLMVCLTGKDAEVDRCREAGFDRVVLKPMHPDTLAEVLAEARARLAAGGAERAAERDAGDDGPASS